MEIQYLQNLENSPVKGDAVIPKDRGVSEIEIIAFEQKVGLPLPKALKEFLFLSGEYCLSIEANATNQGLDEYEFRNEQFQENLDDAKIAISRPYYILTERSGEYFHFIYLDDGENPPVYNIYCWDDEKYKLEKRANSFSDWIDQEIELRLKNRNS